MEIVGTLSVVLFIRGVIAKDPIIPMHLARADKVCSNGLSSLKDLHVCPFLVFSLYAIREFYPQT